MLEPETLRDRARRYREMASTFTDERTINALLQAAADYERQARQTAAPGRSSNRT